MLASKPFEHSQVRNLSSLLDSNDVRRNIAERASERPNSRWLRWLAASWLFGKRHENLRKNAKRGKRNEEEEEEEEEEEKKEEGLAVNYKKKKLRCETTAC